MPGQTATVEEMANAIVAFLHERAFVEIIREQIGFITPEHDYA